MVLVGQARDNRRHAVEPGIRRTALWPRPGAVAQGAAPSCGARRDSNVQMAGAQRVTRLWAASDVGDAAARRRCGRLRSRPWRRACSARAGVPCGRARWVRCATRSVLAIAPSAQRARRTSIVIGLELGRGRACWRQVRTPSGLRCRRPARSLNSTSGESAAITGRPRPTRSGHRRYAVGHRGWIPHPWSRTTTASRVG